MSDVPRILVIEALRARKAGKTRAAFIKACADKRLADKAWKEAGDQIAVKKYFAKMDAKKAKAKRAAFK